MYEKSPLTQPIHSCPHLHKVFAYLQCKERFYPKNIIVHGERREGTHQYVSVSTIKRFEEGTTYHKITNQTDAEILFKSILPK